MDKKRKNVEEDKTGTENASTSAQGVNKSSTLSLSPSQAPPPSAAGSEKGSSSPQSPLTHNMPPHLAAYRYAYDGIKKINDGFRGAVKECDHIHGVLSRAMDELKDTYEPQMDAWVEEMKEKVAAART